MKTMSYTIFKPFLTFCIAALTAGCGTSRYGTGTELCDPSVAKMGDDTYYAGAKCADPAYGVQAANVICRSMGKKSLVTNIRSNSDIVFQCLTPNEAAAHNRPVYENSPNVLIQDSRK